MVVKRLLDEDNPKNDLGKIRDCSIFNFGTVGKVAADQLIDIAKK